MKIHVYFIMDGIQGRETFETSVTGQLNQFLDAAGQFWSLVKELGARTVTPAWSAWGSD